VLDSSGITNVPPPEPPERDIQPLQVK